ncbi:hypothetical protein U9M48_040777 [Paspalum notatum var. saurae]|uniref:Uncharacterized protein n=1 Tax=Paspalum notatum var. saurae TaxID=547442 RepID=A0AAQ3ULU9_PASNO
MPLLRSSTSTDLTLRRSVTPTSAADRKSPRKKDLTWIGSCSLTGEYSHCERNEEIFDRSDEQVPTSTTTSAFYST